MTRTGDAVRRRLGPAARTMRFRIVAAATVAVLAVLVVTGVALVVTQRRTLTGGLDDGIARRADDLASVVTARGAPPVLAGDGDETFAQLVSASGDVLAASPNLAGAGPVAPPPDEGEAEAVRTVERAPVEDGDDDFRVLSRRLDAPGGPVVLHVGANLDDVTESAGALRGSLLVAVPAVAAVLAVLVWWLVGRTLRPVEAIRTEVADIGGRDLDRRVPEPRGDDEIARLARTMNAMLDRLEESASRQQRFVADASHELRSPLGRIRSELEVDLAHPGTADPRETHRSVLEEAMGLERLVDDLLHLARSDSGAAGPVRREPVDLDDVVLRDAGRLRAGGRVSVDISRVSAARVEGDPDQLARAVRNLTDNAARHAASVVTLALGERDGVAVLTVADDGPGIPAAERERVFERFTRLDGARTAGAGGAGLGLAITRDIVERHGGTVVVDDGGGPGARVVVTLPSSA